MQNSSNSPIKWRANPQGLPQPYSTVFDDVYYSSDNGLLETDYVFLQGNQLAQLWLKTAPPTATLQFISTEKYPLTLPEITQALTAWPDLKPVSQPFLDQYHALSNQSVSLFTHRVQLTVLIGDATDCLSETTTLADAWFLDGFSPAKNPEMWQPPLFAQMARLSKSGTTFATFTSAGMVRRSLQSAGFKVIKQAGYWKKREMLIGRFLNECFISESKVGDY